MKIKLLIALLFVISSTFAQTKKTKDIETLTRLWVLANNTQNIIMLNSLYAPTLNFYAINKNKAICIDEKKDFYKKYPNYSISISNLDIDFYKSGIIKSNFIKTEIWVNNTRSPQQAYLLFEKEENTYRIIAESDNRMDAQRGYVPQLGNKVQKSSNITYMLIGAGGLLLILGTIYLIKKKKEQKKKLDPIPMLFNQPVNTEVDVKLPKFTVKELKENHGLAFEQYVVKSFDQDYFKLLHWRGDKYVDGRYPLSNMEPDLDYLYADTVSQQKFAIECKWRSDYYKNSIELGKKRKIDGYKEYAKKVNYPVFIILGMGGSGATPEKIFIIPLDHINSPILKKQEVEKYYRYRKGNFFLHTGIMKLE